MFFASTGAQSFADGTGITITPAQIPSLQGTAVSGSRFSYCAPMGFVEPPYQIEGECVVQNNELSDSPSGQFVRFTNVSPVLNLDWMAMAASPGAQDAIMGAYEDQYRQQLITLVEYVAASYQDLYKAWPDTPKPLSGMGQVGATGGNSASGPGGAYDPGDAGGSFDPGVGGGSYDPYGAQPGSQFPDDSSMPTDPGVGSTGVPGYGGSTSPGGDGTVPGYGGSTPWNSGTGGLPGDGSLASYDPSGGLGSGYGLGPGGLSGGGGLGADGAADGSGLAGGVGGTGTDPGGPAGASAARSAMPMAPSSAPGGKDDKGRSRTAYLTEDESVWGVSGTELEGGVL